jgi:hypothetical protein
MVVSLYMLGDGLILRLVESEFSQMHPEKTLILLIMRKTEV